MRHFHKDDVLFWTALTGNTLDAQEIKKATDMKEAPSLPPCRDIKKRVGKNERFKSQLGELGFAMLRQTKGGE